MNQDPRETAPEYPDEPVAELEADEYGPMALDAKLERAGTHVTALQARVAELEAELAGDPIEAGDPAANLLMHHGYAGLRDHVIGVATQHGAVSIKAHDAIVAYTRQQRDKLKVDPTPQARAALERLERELPLLETMLRNRKALAEAAERQQARDKITGR